MNSACNITGIERHGLNVKKNETDIKGRKNYLNPRTGS